MKTIVIFRKYDNEIIAFFPYEIADHHGNMLSYQHIGQHSPASLDFYRDCKPTKPEEYNDLMNELRLIGYWDLEVRGRMNVRKWQYAWMEVLKQITY